MEKQLKSAYTIKDAAQYLKVSTGFLYKLTSSGKISFYKPNGGRVYFTQDDLDAYLFRGRHKADFELEDQASAYIAGGYR